MNSDATQAVRKPAWEVTGSKEPRVHVSRVSERLGSYAPDGYTVQSEVLWRAVWPRLPFQTRGQA